MYILGRSEVVYQYEVLRNSQINILLQVSEFEVCQEQWQLEGKITNFFTQFCYHLLHICVLSTFFRNQFSIVQSSCTKQNNLFLNSCQGDLKASQQIFERRTNKKNSNGILLCTSKILVNSFFEQTANSDCYPNSNFKKLKLVEISNPVKN